MLSRKRIAVLVILVIIAANLFLAFRILVTPERLRSLAEQRVRELLPGAAIGGAEIEQYLGQVKFNDLKLPREEGGPLATIAWVRVNFSLFSLATSNPVIRRIEVQGLNVDGVFEFVEELEKVKLVNERKASIQRVVFRNCRIAVEAGKLYDDNPRLVFTDIFAGATAASPAATSYSIKMKAAQQLLGDIAMRAEADVEDKSFDGTVSMPAIVLKKPLRESLPKSRLKIWDAFDPTGEVALEVELKKKPAQPLTFYCTAEASKASIEFVKFPVRVTDIEGTVETDGKTVWMKDFKGHRGKGTVHMVKGRSSHKGGKVDLSLRIDDIAVDDEITKACPAELRKLLDKCGVTSGTFDMDYRFKKTLDDDTPFVSVTTHLEGFAARHEAFPLPLKDICGTVNWSVDSGSEIDLRSHSGDATVVFSGRIPSKGVTSDRPNLTIAAEGLALDDTLSRALDTKPKLKELWPKFSPSGYVDATVRLTITPGSEEPPPVSVLIEPQAAGFTLQQFPMEVSRVVGKITWDDKRVEIVDLSGRIGPAHVRVDGSITAGERPSEPNLRIRVSNLELTPELRKALPDTVDEIWEKLQPTGRLDATIEAIYDPTDDAPPKMDVTIQPQSAGFTYAGCPLKVSKLTGRASWDGNRIELSNLFGEIGKGNVRINGQIDTQKSPDGPNVRIEVRGLDLTPDVFDALPDKVQAVRRDLNPKGTVDVEIEATVDPTSDNAPPPVVEVRPRGCSVQYAPLPYPLKDVSGSITAKGDIITLKSVRASAGTGEVILNGSITTAGASTSSEIRLELINLPLDDNLRSILPEKHHETWNRLKPSGLLDGVLKLKTTKAGGNTTVTVLSGSSLELSKLCLHGRRLPELTAGITYADGELNIADIIGSAYAGRLSGRFTMDCKGGEGYRGELSVKNTDLRLMAEELKTDNKKTKGTLSGRAKFTGADFDARGIIGDCSFTIRNGNLATAPGVYRIITVLSLKLPRGSEITDAEVEFHMEDGLLDVSKIDLFGTGLPVHGTGTLDLDGQLNLLFVTGKTTVESVWDWIPIVGDILNWTADKVRRNLMQIKVTGVLADPTAQVVPLPGVTKPVKGFLRLIRVMKQKEPEKPDKTP